MELEPTPPPPPVEPPSTCPDQSTASDPTEDDRTESKPSLSQTDILRALEVVERDSSAIAESYVDHMQCFSDAAGRLQESVLDASTKGNRYINSCLRLNEEMKGVDSLATQLKLLRRNVDALDSAVNKLLRLP
ncbi:hypothetical protein CFP56_001432 [Quercus suber]|uniref:BLOC-1-related complex subunit 6 C-terminal helix domain-containing protein n=1 Tax=Quercus suber TaxID=58331 RepID=A0AAW0IMI8_QUESU